ncbi:MAG TPA: hypothetical protein VHX44_00380 [Planctomycetota bacterium]|nr:hypothetical protein [Planctomycetota bacterium]
MSTHDSLVTYLAEHPIAQDEREAVVTLMLVTMYADKKLTLEENATLRRYEKLIKWDSGMSLSYFFSNTIAAVRSAMRDEAKLSALLANAFKRIHSDAIRTLTIKACNDMVGADFKREASEMDLLKRIVTGLGG